MEGLKIAAVVCLVIGVILALGGFVLLDSQYDNPEQLNWQPVSAPEPDMECWRWDGNYVVVCRW